MEAWAALAVTVSKVVLQLACSLRPADWSLACSCQGQSVSPLPFSGVHLLNNYGFRTVIVNLKTNPELKEEKLHWSRTHQNTKMFLKMKVLFQLFFQCNFFHCRYTLYKCFNAYITFLFHGFQVSMPNFISNTKTHCHCSSPINNHFYPSALSFQRGLHCVAENLRDRCRKGCMGRYGEARRCAHVALQRPAGLWFEWHMGCCLISLGWCIVVSNN